MHEPAPTAANASMSLPNAEPQDSVHQQQESAEDGAAAEDMDEFAVVEMGPSVYSDIIITLAARKPLSFRAVSFCMLIATCCFEAAFLRMIQQISVDNIGPKMGYIEWRSNPGACLGLDWSWQERVIRDMGDYSEFILGFRNGLVLGMLAIALWTRVCVKEWCDSVKYLLLVTLPHREWEENDYIVTEKGQGKIESLNRMIKGVVIVVFLWRITICGSFLVQGLMFLSYTETLEDIVLNSLALGFVFEIDEMAFTLLPPSHELWQKRLEDIEIKLQKQPSSEGQPGDAELDNDNHSITRVAGEMARAIVRCLQTSAIPQILLVMVLVASGYWMYLAPFNLQYSEAYGAVGCR